MNITLKTEYALRALYEMMSRGDADQPVNRRQIAERQGISEHFLEKIFIALQKSDIIKSVRGPGGGFVLGEDPDGITLWDVYSAVDDPGYTEGRCCPQLPREACLLQGDCKVKNLWFKFASTLKENMTGIKLVDVFRSR